MVVIYRAYGLRFVIFVDDHEPVHVHVRSDGEAKVTLIGDPEIVRVNEMTRTDQRRMMRVIRQQQEMLLGEWSRIHGRN